jgi:hypothetical protein
LKAAIIILAALLLANAAARAQDTLKPGDTISGKLRLVETRHPNGTLLRAFQVVVDTPKMFAKEDEFCDGPPKTFQLVADKPAAATLRPLLGKKIAVIAEDMMCSETAWHVGDAVVFKWRLADPVQR